jgi:hypothetical protein
MHLARLRLVGLGPFDDLTLSFSQTGGAPRPLTMILGSGGVGKSTLLGAIASTRPGYAVALNRAPRQAHAVAHWHLGLDDPGRPHPLRVCTPSAQLDEPEDEALHHRREQALFDKRAAEQGFVLLHFPAVRWFSRAPLVLTAPERSLLRYDVRATTTLDDATRADLARETKQTLSYASIAAALVSRGHQPQPRLLAFEQTLRRVVSTLVGLTGHAYLGADPISLEPIFQSPSERILPFDELPTATRHLAAFGALTLRALLAAYPETSLLHAEATVLIDEIELHQEASVARRIAPALRQALPRVQWILTTSSASVAASCETDELLALRRTPPSERIELHEGPIALVH